MTRVWRPVVMAAILCLGVGAMAISAAAAKPHQVRPHHHHRHTRHERARLDPSFGRHGTEAVGTGVYLEKALPPARLAVAAGGRSYVLQGTVLLAFSSNGKLDRSFGENGGVRVNPEIGMLLQMSGVAVDPEGRVLVMGAVYPISGWNPVAPGNGPGGYANERAIQAFIARYLPDGKLDPTFGSAGEETTALGLPRPTNAPFGDPTGEYELPFLISSRISVDAQSRPVIAGEYVKALDGTCRDNRAFVARLTSSGSEDTTFGGRGYVILPGARANGLAAAPNGDWAVLSEAGPEGCGAEGRGSRLSTLAVLTETGGLLSGLDPSRPPLVAGATLAVDPKGRILYVERNSTRLIRLLPSGDRDTSFGRGGAVNLKRFRNLIAAIAVDLEGRVVVGFRSRDFELTRLTAKGQVEGKFGHRGLLRTKIARVGAMSLETLAIDSRQRILAAGAVSSPALNVRVGVGIARFLSGR